MVAGRLLLLATCIGAAVAVEPSGPKRPGAASGPAGGARFADRSHLGELSVQMSKLRALHKKPAKPRRGEWLYEHAEPGQTFGQYLATRPMVPTSRRSVIYVQPLGRFTDQQGKIVGATGRFLALYFGLEVRLLDALPDSVVPASARRVHPQWGDRQILTGYVLADVLVPRLPDDAFAYIALTAGDLWPGEGWNFVLGSASLRDRVGVWSLYRHGDPSAGEAPYRLCLLRTMKTASHELGHMFSMLHCTAYECNMCGSHSGPASDRRPISLCPECLAKICWATGAEPAKRYADLAEWYRSNGLHRQAEFCDRSLAALGAKQTTRPTATSRPGSVSP